MLSVRGDASEVDTARKLLELYGRASQDQRREFLQLLGSSFGPDKSRVEAAIAQYASQPDAIEELHAATEPVRARPCAKRECNDEPVDIAATPVA